MKAYSAIDRKYSLTKFPSDKDSCLSVIRGLLNATILKH